MTYGYARVSTKGQAASGNSLEVQKDALRSAGAEMIFADVFSGKKMERPEFDRLLEVLKSGDVVIVTRLDRFARSISQASGLITKLIDTGVVVHVLNIGKMDNTPSGKLIRNIFLSFAEFERDMILERTAEGKVIARQRPGYREGRRPKYGREQIGHALDLLGNHSYKQVERMTGISASTLVRAKRKKKQTEGTAGEEKKEAGKWRTY